jgi:DnaA family protein
VTEIAQQLPLQLRLDEQATLENFLAGPAVQPLLRTLRDGDAEAVHFLHGPAEVGKSHLLQAACQQRAGRVAYLPLAELGSADPQALLADLERCACLAIDDLHAVLPEPRWEEALFHLVNRCRESGCQLLLAARRPPADLGVQLPDLRSRLAGGLTWALPPQDDAERLRILALRAARRGLPLSPAVLEYLGRRASRSLRELLAILERLDVASLREQRSITVPLVRRIMGW